MNKTAIAAVSENVMVHGSMLLLNNLKTACAVLFIMFVVATKLLSKSNNLNSTDAFFFVCKNLVWKIH